MLIRQALKRAPTLVAADGGANVALALGLMPDAVIGDLDSISPETRAAIAPDRLHRVAEQETTDFEKCLTRIDAPAVLAVGFAGLRLDHTLAVWNALVRHPHRRCIVIAAGDIAFLAPERLQMKLPVGTRLSLFPLGAVTGQSRGLRWPIDGLDFAPDGRIGTSNRTEGPVDLTFSAPRMLVLLPRRCLDAALLALS